MYKLQQPQGSAINLQAASPSASMVSFGFGLQMSEADVRLLASGAWTHLKALNLSNVGMDAKRHRSAQSRGIAFAEDPGSFLQCI